MSAPVIHIENLCVKSRNRTILSVEELTVGRGEVFVVFGPNGAGKSTLLKASLGLQRISAGTISVLGKRVQQLNSIDLSRLRSQIGYVSQNLSLSGEMPITVREVIAIGRTGIAGLFRRLGKRDWFIVEKWIERLGLRDLAGQSYSELSGGEKRKTLIAKGMVQEPEILLLDEPTSHLDIGWREEIVRTIQELYKQMKMTIIMVCHELEVIPPCCSQFVILNEGKVLDMGNPREVLTNECIRSLYGSGFNVQYQSGRYVLIPDGRII